MSFRGIDQNSRTISAAIVMDRMTLLFPDYQGNKLFNSLGNILVNPHIGMLFIDLVNARRLRVNGRAEIVEQPSDLYMEIWPSAVRLVKVTAQQVYANCQRNIHRSISAHYDQNK